MILEIQIAGILFGLAMIYVTFLKFKRRELTSREYSVWMTVWTVFMFMTLFPKLLDPIASTLNFARTFDLFVVAGFLFVISVSFLSYTTVIKNQKRVEDIVRKLALEKKK